MDRQFAGQIVGIIAMFFMIISFQQKKQKGLILLQLVGSFLFMIHFYLMGAMVGFLMNAIGSFRALIFSNKDKFKADNIIWVFVFVALFIITYILSFATFGMEMTVGNFIIEVLPVIGMTLTTISFRMKEARNVRMLSLFNSPMWLVYNIFRQSIGGALCEIFNLVSIIIGIIRLDINWRKNK